MNDPLYVAIDQSTLVGATVFLTLLAVVLLGSTIMAIVSAGLLQGHVERLTQHKIGRIGS